MPDLFKEIVPAIMRTKQRVVVTKDDEKDYNAFIVNRALSQHLDCVLPANQMNLNAHLEPKMQFDFLLNIVRGYKRPWQTWNKYEKPDDLDLIKEYYSCSSEKALVILNLLGQDQIQQIREYNNKGGVDNVRKSSRGKTKEKK